MCTCAEQTPSIIGKFLGTAVCKVNPLERTFLKWNASAVNCPSNTAHQRFKNVAFAETSVWERRQAPAERLALTLLL